MRLPPAAPVLCARSSEPKKRKFCDATSKHGGASKAQILKIVLFSDFVYKIFQGADFDNLW